MNLIIIIHIHIHIIILISRASSSLTRQVKVTLKILKNLTGLHERMIRCICMWSFFCGLLWKKIYHQTEKHLIHLPFVMCFARIILCCFFVRYSLFAPFFSLPPWKPINHQPEPTCAWTWITTTKTKIIAPWNLFVYGYYTTHTHRHLSNEKLPKKKKNLLNIHP